MSFRNYGATERQNIKIQETGPSQLFLTSKFPTKTGTSTMDHQILTKIADLIVNLHETLLLKCQNIEVYRDLSKQEQNLLLQTDKNTSLHTVLAGTLAIDSCIKSLEKEEQFVVGNLLRANSALISNYKSLEREHSQNRILSQTIEHLNDSIKFVTQQLQALPSTKGLEHELQKHLAILESSDLQESEEWLKTQHTNLMSDLQKENEVLRIGFKQKESYIKTLESRLQRSGNKLQKTEQRKIGSSSKLRVNTQKSSEGSSSHTEMQQLYQEVVRLREELQEKSKIIYKMNEEFASQMEKYNSVFRRLEEQNRILKKYNDVDTAYLLQELQVELDMLREQKRKDQLIISDIQSKIQVISYPRMSRANTHQRVAHQLPLDRFEGYNEPHHPQYPDRNMRPKQFYSPSYSSRFSPYSRGPREEGYYPPPPPGNQSYRARASRRDEMRNKSRARYQAMQESRESKQLIETGPNPNINLLERVMNRR